MNPIASCVQGVNVSLNRHGTNKTFEERLCLFIDFPALENSAGPVLEKRCLADGHGLIYMQCKTDLQVKAC